LRLQLSIKTEARLHEAPFLFDYISFQLGSDIFAFIVFGEAVALSPAPGLALLLIEIGLGVAGEQQHAG
jgi:hypothetical protein